MRLRLPALRPLALTAALALFVGAVVLVSARPARACGGCFSPTTAPTDDLVVQDGERVLFHRDPTTDVTTVWVEVRYTGAAQDFGWVLPLEKPPVVGTGPRYVFDLLDKELGVQHRTTRGADENCESPWIGCVPVQRYPTNEGFSDTTSSSDASTGGYNGPGSVTVIDQGQTGPYDYVVLTASDAQPLYDWLNAKGYATPSAATPILQSHIAKGDVFVAVKLQNGAGVDLIRPITLTMQGSDPCVPLRLTSIAAQDDMTVSVTLAGPGRAVPKNHFNVVVNPARLNWLSSPPANNYAQVAAAAIDEAAGHAFVTEYAGHWSGLGGTATALRSAQVALASTTTAYEVGMLLSERPELPVTDETAALFAEHLALAELAPGASPAKAIAVLRACVGAWEGFMPNDTCSIEGVTLERTAVTASAVDGAALADALDADFITPVADALDLIAGAPKVTRLMMRISPSEMDRDPIFDFNADLPDVSNVVIATVSDVCTTGWSPPDARRVALDGLGSWVVDTATGSSALDPRFADAPLALRVELLDGSGGPRLIAPTDVPLVDAAIVGALPGTPSLPAELVLQPASEWTPPPSDLLVTERGPWPMPSGCDAKPGWRDGHTAPLTADGQEASSGGGGGCATGGGTGSVPLAVALALALVALLGLRRARQRRA